MTIDILDSVLDSIDEDARAIAVVKAKWGQSATFERSTLGIEPNENGGHTYHYRMLRFNDFCSGAKAQQAAEWEKHANDPEKLAREYEQRRSTALRYNQDFNETPPK